MGSAGWFVACALLFFAVGAMCGGLAVRSSMIDELENGIVTWGKRAWSATPIAPSTTKQSTTEGD